MVTCPNCGTPATDNDIFCNGCGQRLPSPAAPPAGAPVSASPPLPPMPGPPPVTPAGAQPVYTPPPQQPQVIQPSFQQPVTPSYGQGQPQQPVIQPSYGQATPVYGQPPAAAQPPKKKISGCLIAIIVVVVLALCGGVVVAGIAIVPGLLPSATPTLTPYSGGNNNTGSTSGDTSIDVVNNLNVAICYLYISPSASEDWGEDWLFDIGTIEPGFSATFYITEGETVDMQAEDCNGNTLDNQYEVYVPAEGLTYTLNP